MMRMKWGRIVAAAALAVAGLTVAAPASAHDKHDHAVEKYAPVHSTSCEGWSYAHPAYKHSSGAKPSSYTIRVGDAAEFEDYTPGTVVASDWENPYKYNSVRVTVRAHYSDGKPFAVHQLGQTLLWSYACEVPTQPEPIVVHGDWTGEFECGDTTVDEAREVTTTGHVWTGREWVAGDPVTTTETRTRDLTAEELGSLECEVDEPPVVEPPVEEPPVEEPPVEEPPVVEPPVEEPPVVEPPVVNTPVEDTPTEKPATNTSKQTPKIGAATGAKAGAQTQELAATGGEITFLGAGIALAAGGVLLMRRARMA